VTIIIGSVFVVSKAISSSGILDGLIRQALRNVHSPSAQVGVLTACVAFLSAFVKNVGTLGIFIPIAIQVARRSKQSASIYLMPLAFGSLIGGTITLIGTSPNLLISSVRQDLRGEPFHLFDFVWVGLPLTYLSIAFLSVGWRLSPKGRRGSLGADEAFEIEKYTTELLITDKSPLAGKRVGDLEQFGDKDTLVRAITREGGHHYLPHNHWQLYAGDIITVQTDSEAIKTLTNEARLELVRAKELE
jgi:di/tricarboxylate transporter